jgi:hypothetical protein
MREFRKITIKELIPHLHYQIGKFTFILSPARDKYYFQRIDGLGNDIAFTQFGISRTEILDFIGVYANGEFPEISLEKMEKVYNWLHDRWMEIEGIQETEAVKTEVTLDGGEIILFPLSIESQEHWHTTWQKLSKSGFRWADGDELDDLFSECHEFPAHIDYVNDQKITIHE